MEVGNPNVVWSASEDGTLRQHDFREASSCPPAGSAHQECRNVLVSAGFCLLCKFSLFVCPPSSLTLNLCNWMVQITVSSTCSWINLPLSYIDNIFPCCSKIFVAAYLIGHADLPCFPSLLFFSNFFEWYSRKEYFRKIHRTNTLDPLSFLHRASEIFNMVIQTIFGLTVLVLDCSLICDVERRGH